MTEQGPRSDRRLLIATGNAKKGIEMAQLLAPLGLRILTFDDLPEPVAEVEETGITYEANALLKARAAAEITGMVSIADDAGLEIDALGGAPGIFSRRFLGEETSFPDKMVQILEMISDVPDAERGCRFRAAVAIAVPGEEARVCHGVCEGRVARELRGQHGFGYDPFFLLPGLGRHMAELTPDEKHAISHRGMAMACATAELRSIFG